VKKFLIAAAALCVVAPAAANAKSIFYSCEGNQIRLFDVYRDDPPSLQVNHKVHNPVFKFDLEKHTATLNTWSCDQISKQDYWKDGDNIEDDDAVLKCTTEGEILTCREEKDK
jgi:hypothetical protein